ncbi:hypothetical protein ACFSQ3_00565 [Sphingobacterium corticis]|uniref:Tetratricopeptide repeat protein n=1 Tax=Sphingobacterium corticis TaxID=1812823 RepID=A0ABW5NE08_9SPHI
MNIAAFKQTLTQLEPNANWSAPLKALWYEAKGDWHTAHALVDHLSDQDSAHVHAYLHRVEGDQWNANYWYSRAKEEPYLGTLEQEWEALMQKFL